MKSKPLFLFLLPLVLLLPAALAGQVRGARGTRGQPPTPPSGKRDPLTLAQVIESLYTFGSKSTEDAIKDRKVTFQHDPLVVEILKEFGATDAILSLIPPVPPPPPPKYSGPLTIKCDPVDCLVVINDRFYGVTQGREKTVTNLPVGEATIQVFNESYQAKTQKLALDENNPLEATFALELREEIGLSMVKDSLLEIIRAMGGIDGVSSLGEFEGEGTMDWTDSTGQRQNWPMTFKKRSGKDVSLVFKTQNGQCTASILGETQKRECKGKLKNSGEDVSQQAATLFAAYQMQDVVNTLLTRLSGITVADNGKRLEISGSYDSYALNCGLDKLPAELTYKRTDKPDSAVKVIYSEYTYVGKGRYPTKMEIAPLNGAPGFVFTLQKLRSLSNSL
jgi:hypothetical protein